MARTLEKAKSRRERGPFITIPHSVLVSENFILLSGSALRLLTALLSQLRFKGDGKANNGDLCAAFSIMEDRKWSSRESLAHAIEELLYYRFIEITRQGSKRKCYLYAITWWAIDECNGKLDSSETRIPSNNWKVIKPKWERPKRKQKIDSVTRNSGKPPPYNGTKQDNLSSNNELLPVIQVISHDI